MPESFLSLKLAPCITQPNSISHFTALGLHGYLTVTVWSLFILTASSAYGNLTVNEIVTMLLVVNNSESVTTPTLSSHHVFTV